MTRDEIIGKYDQLAKLSRLESMEAELKANVSVNRLGRVLAALEDDTRTAETPLDLKPILNIILFIIEERKTVIKQQLNLEL